MAMTKAKKRASKKEASARRLHEAQQRPRRVEPAASATAPVALKIGDFQLRAFSGIDAAFGASLTDYPPMDIIPVEFQRGHTKFNDVVSALFFRGSSLEDHGIQLKPSVDQAAAFTALRTMLCSFAPKHEHKSAALAWALSEWTTPLSGGDAR